MSKKYISYAALCAAVAFSASQTIAQAPAARGQPKAPSAEVLQKATSLAIGNLAWESVRVSEVQVEGAQVKWLATMRSNRYHCGADLNGENMFCNRPEPTPGAAPPAVAAAPAPRPAAAPTMRRNMINVASADRGYFYYVSSKYNASGYNFVVYALHDDGQTAEDFAKSSGWIKLAEDNGFVVVFPEAVNKTWAPNSGGEDAYLKAVYDHAATHLVVGPPAGAGGPPAGGGGAPRGAEGGAAPAGGPGGPGGARGAPRAQTWQPFHYLTGVGAGAIAAQELAINHPGVFAAVATVDGVAYDAAYAKGNEPAQGYLMNQRGGKNASPTWKQLKREVPVAAWLFTTGAPTPAEAKVATYWKRSDAVAATPQTSSADGFQTAVFTNPQNPSQQVRTTVLPADAKYDAKLSSAIWNDFFRHTARWTSSANGDVGPMMTEEEVNKTFDVHTTVVNGVTYKYYVKTPSTYKKGQSLPLVISAHGAMYPAWLYASQIRMHDVGEKEGFITVYISGQQNRWDFTKPDTNDAKFVEQVINEIGRDYGTDRSRVYMQGFSFGSGLTYMMGVAHPELFAAVSPNNGIGPMSPEVKSQMAERKAKGVRIPMMIVYGAVDAGGSTDGLVPAQGVLRDSIDEMKDYNRITARDTVVTYNSPNSAPYEVLNLGGKAVMAGTDPRFPTGRFKINQYSSADPTPQNLFSFVWVADLPHGGDPREAQLEWDYFKKWRRNPDGTLAFTAR